MKIVCNKAPVHSTSNRTSNVRRQILAAFSEIGYRRVGTGVCFSSTVGACKDLIFQDWEGAKQWLIKAGCWKTR